MKYIARWDTSGDKDSYFVVETKMDHESASVILYLESRWVAESEYQIRDSYRGCHTYYAFRGSEEAMRQEVMNLAHQILTGCLAKVEEVMGRVK